MAKIPMQESLPYLIALAILIAAILLFFLIAWGRFRNFGAAQAVLRVFVALPLPLSAVLLHFLRTNEATSMIPPVFAATQFLVLLTGALEILGAIGLFVPRVRRTTTLGIAILMVAVFPVNVYVAGQTFGGLPMPNVPIRLTMQVVYIWLILIAGFGLPRARISPRETNDYSE